MDEERSALTRLARQLHLQEYWVAQPDFQSTAPRSAAVPHLWRWADVAPVLRKTGEIIGVGAHVAEAERRALILSNPGLGGRPDITTTLYADLQLVRPGEVAPAHRHTTTANRFIMEGEGGFTVVAGEKVTMSRGDFVNNPAWLWHDFGNEGGEDAIWLDVLDVPLVTTLNGVFYDYDFWKEGDLDKTAQSVRQPPDHSHALYGIGGVAPRFVGPADRLYSRQLVYRWASVRAALDRLRGWPGSPYDALILEYTNPETGGSVAPTMGFAIQLLRPGEQTRAHRHTASTVYCVVEGQGYTQVDRQRLEWSGNDVFVVPGWAWHHHVNLRRSADAVLFSASDAPALEKLGLYREEARTETGDIVSVTG
ncbi:MAG: cupin domain-containing protein [Candidatus Rokubacteria bacterium]|nr:cupin domain-containing protein [Candidatus Rokubacteria bacterium]